MMAARINYILIVMAALLSGAAVWLDWRAVTLAALAYGVHRARPLLVVLLR